MRTSLITVALVMLLAQSVSYAMHHEGGPSNTGELYLLLDAGVLFEESASNPFFGRAGIGYSEGMFSAEAAYFESDNAWNGNAWAKIRGGDFSLLVRPFKHDVLQHFYVRAGGHYSRVWGGGTGYTSVSYKGVGWLAGAGFDMPINDHISIHAGFSHYGAAAGREALNADGAMGGFRLKF